ncbi:MAG: hypothetical protein ACRD5M_08670 [Candidatus Acidiferrales bacterium]
MGRNLARWLLVLAFATSSCLALGQETKTPAKTFRLDSLSGLEIMNIKADVVDYRGRRAVRLHKLESQDLMVNQTKDSLAILGGTDFKDGTIEAEIAGLPAEGAAADARGFIGIAFRVTKHGERYECFYIRPTNGRADEQVRRNHSVQYVSAPDYPWHRLRKEHPGEYESYADLEAGAWTKIKIVVAGTKAKLYLNDAEQPCLIVNDLKLGDSRGRIALWTTVETDGYFSNLTVK